MCVKSVWVDVLLRFCSDHMTPSVDDDAEADVVFPVRSCMYICTYICAFMMKSSSYMVINININTNGNKLIILFRISLCRRYMLFGALQLFAVFVVSCHSAPPPAHFHLDHD